MAHRKKLKKVTHAQLDKYFSLLIRERAENRCENCNSDYIPQCSHHIGRSKSLRYKWAPENACCHCRGCHAGLTYNPFDHYKWIENFLGKEVWEDLRTKARGTNHYSQPQLRKILQNLKDSWVLMQQQRRETDGRLEFDDPYP